ncbi:MAG TPA: outer membrane beta-barrel protein [Thermoanaerobaculia bacterium]|jgi:opacity protein-like surface antigen|nr:outer membrane beta-barrel protein [Thermoanaerobaculia bacterium]
MRRSLLILLLLTFTTSAFAQDEDWRRRRADNNYGPRDGAFELAPFIGYRWGGTIFADQTFIFGEDVDVAPSANFGVNFALPLGDTGMKLELMANRQSSELETEGGLFDPTDEVADIDVTYLHAGLQIPFARSRNATPYFVVSGGLANLDPQVSGVSAENRFSASAGLGVKLPVSNALSIKLEGRGYYTALEEEDDCTICDYFYNEDFYQGEVNLGLVFSF